MALIARPGPPADRPARPPGCADAVRMRDWLSVLFGGQAGLVGATAVGIGDQQPAAGATGSVRNSLHAANPLGLWNLARLARELSPRARAVYVNLNPVDSLCQGVPRNGQIVQRRWLLIDADPVRPADSNASSQEKEAAQAAVLAVRRWLAEQFRFPRPILADSGNGYHLLYRIDLPNDDAASLLVKQVLNAVATFADTQAVTIDRKVHDARRVVKLYGTLARKGPHTASRPHRTSAILDVPSPLESVTRAQLEALVAWGQAQAAGPPVAPVGVQAPVPPTGSGGSGEVARDATGKGVPAAYARAALERERAELVATRPGNRNNQLFKSAASLFSLVNVGQLTEAEVVHTLEHAAREIGLAPAEVSSALRSARRATEGQGRDLTKLQKPASRSKKPQPCGPVEPFAKMAGANPDAVREHVDDPHRLARGYKAACCTHADGPTLIHWNGEWWAWEASRGQWRIQPDHELASAITVWMKRELDQAAQEQDRLVKPLSTRAVANVMHMLRALVTVPVASLPAAPAWLAAKPGDPDPLLCLPTRNAIIHLPALLEPVSGQRAIWPITPRLFATNSLSYEFDPEAACPTHWLTFLKSIWGADPDSITTLQEWFGYLLTPSTTHQKILLILGPRRSGKGTIARTLRALVGEANVAAPTLSSLAGPFGLQPLIGKTVCLCPESRLTGRSDTQAIVERLLSVSGEDPQSVDRKHLTPWHGTLASRFVLLGNEFPRLSDYSDAILGRLVVLKMTQSWHGKETLDLGSRIQAELPGILLWAIAGWQRLHQRGRFIQPASGQEELKDATSLLNPIGSFLNEQCLIGQEHKASPSELYEAWKAWCQRNGREHPGDLAGFTRTLKSQPNLNLREYRPNQDGQRVRYYLGIALKPGPEAAF